LDHFIRQVIEPFNVRKSVAAVFHVLAVLLMYDADMGSAWRHGEYDAIVIDRDKSTFGLPNGEALITKVINDNEHLSSEIGYGHLPSSFFGRLGNSTFSPIPARKHSIVRTMPTITPIPKLSLTCRLPRTRHA
jgi:hypothetical protein